MPEITLDAVRNRYPQHYTMAAAIDASSETPDGSLSGAECDLFESATGVDLDALLAHRLPPAPMPREAERGTGLEDLIRLRGGRTGVQPLAQPLGQPFGAGLGSDMGFGLFQGNNFGNIAAQGRKYQERHTDLAWGAAQSLVAGAAVPSLKGGIIIAGQTAEWATKGWRMATPQLVTKAANFGSTAFQVTGKSLLRNSAWGASVGAFISVGENAFAVAKGERTMGEAAVDVGKDALIGAASATASAVAAGVVGGVCGIAAAPVIAAIGAGVAVGMALHWLFD
jgi:hypothetical protein